MAARKSAPRLSNPGPGLPVDARGNPTVDPTKNVLDLVEASVRRIDDVLGEIVKRFEHMLDAHDKIDADRIVHVKEMAELRAQHADQMNKKESDRIDAIRQVDVGNTQATATAANNAIQALAATTTTNAENIRNAVVSTAAAMAKQLETTVARIDERISQLERSTAESVGKQRVVDPQMAEMIVEMKRVRSGGDTQRGQAIGRSELIGWLVAAAAIFAAIIKYIT